LHFEHFISDEDRNHQTGHRPTDFCPQILPQCKSAGIYYISEVARSVPHLQPQSSKPYNDKVTVRQTTPRLAMTGLQSSFLPNSFTRVTSNASVATLGDPSTLPAPTGSTAAATSSPEGSVDSSLRKLIDDVQTELKANEGEQDAIYDHLDAWKKHRRTLPLQKRVRITVGNTREVRTENSLGERQRQLEQEQRGLLQKRGDLLNDLDQRSRQDVTEAPRRT
jgi:hypothetical protein